MSQRASRVVSGEPPGKVAAPEETLQAMSRRSDMSPRARRAWAIGIVAFFIVMCAAIALSQWWAIHVNVPNYESKKHAQAKPV
jgi:hypothetical protein